jgi:hypothetical protein
MKGKSKSQTAGWIEAIKGLNRQDSCQVPIVESPDPRDAEIAKLLALCGEAYRFICRTSSAPYSVCGHPRSDEYAEIELKLKAAAQALEETAQRIRKEIKG